SAAAILAFVTTGNSGILAASRSPMAMSRDDLLPRSLQKISRRYGTPHFSILLTSGFMIAMISLLNIADLVKVASTMKLLLFLLMNVAVLIMRGSKIQNYRPVYRLPLFPWLPLAGIAMYAFLIVIMTNHMGRAPLVTTVVFMLAGTLWYILYVRPRTSRESALVYMVRRAISKEIYRSTLEEELKQIALDRDEVKYDRFDRLVRSCAILDLPESTSATDMFRLVAKELGPRIGIDHEKLMGLFQAREAQSSTVVQPGLAIPHIIVDGVKVFDVLLVRCKEGIRFPGVDQPVRAAFVLIGSADERNYHLRALMAIAHIAQEHDFTQRWLKATDSEHLRDIVLLSRRSRDEPGG
ncbi:MAG: amino acid permease, partial [Anaerolineales bacterium]